jgi:hypothetical protein
MNTIVGRNKIIMKYKVIFTTGYDDIDSISKELKCDILILDNENNYYNPQYITLNRIKGEFDGKKVCYLEDNLVILHKITKDNILKSIIELDKWMFTKRWIPLNEKQLVEYFYPKRNWLIFDIET